MLDVEVDTERFEARIVGRQVTLTAKEFDFLWVLATSSGRAFTRAQLIEQGLRLRPPPRAGAHGGRACENLRRKIEPDPAKPRYVLTVPGRGYKFTDGPCA